MRMKPLGAEKLRLRTDPTRLPFDDTADLPDADGPVGQDRALRAIDFGARMAQPGYNIFVSGPNGAGKRTSTNQILAQWAASMPLPRDWCYVQNFVDTHHPKALNFPAGQGVQFKHAMAQVADGVARDRGAAKAEIGGLVRPLWDRFGANRDAQAHLEAVYRDVMALADSARSEEVFEERSFPRYDVNLLVDNAQLKSAPIVSLELPSLSRLAGKIEHAPVPTATDFMSIRPGALHQANGGFLLIDAMNLLQQKMSWEALKRALINRKIRIESFAGLKDRVGIQPDPIPLDIKIVLFGEPWIYHRLRQADPDFADLFKVQADFAASADRTDVHCGALLRLMASAARRDGLRQFDRTGAARLLDEASRMTCDAGKISVRTGRLADLAREADHFAKVGGHALIAENDVVQAMEAKEDRDGRFKALEHELIRRQFVFIDTDGVKAGQVNGLTVLAAPGFAFGVPARITARVRPGNGRVIDIERLAQFSGPAHIKGVHILSGYLNGTYSNGHALSVSASVAFEQSHALIDGDSASAAELIAILSAIAEVPLKQSIAITGSINQHGAMQPIGGVNEKIEGFFDVCAMRGLASHHGVIIPKANVAHLMLRDDVVRAARERRFFVHAVETVDEAIELLSGLKAGARRGRKGFARGTFNARVADRLIYFARPRVLKPVRIDGWWPFQERERVAPRSDM